MKLKFFLWLKILLLIGLIGCVCIALINIYVYFYGKSGYSTLDDAPQADAIIILGARVWGDTPSPMLADRLAYGYELYRRGTAPKIIVSGDHGTPEYDEVDVMRNYLLEKGVPSKDIFMDHAGFDTYSTMYRAREIFQVKSAVVVTQNFHLSRAVYLAKKLGLTVNGVASDPQRYQGIAKSILREIPARVKAFLEADILKPKPKFLGEPIPITGNGEQTLGPEDKIPFDR